MVYFPVNFPVELDPAGHSEESSGDGTAAPERRLQLQPTAVSYSPNGRFMAVLTPGAVHLWSSHPLARLSTHRRSGKSLLEYGENLLVSWSSGDSLLVFATGLGYLMFLQLTQATEPYTLKLAGNPIAQFAAENLASFEPAQAVFRAATAVIHHKITSVDSRQDEVMVATTAGVIERFSWTTRQFDAAAAIVLNGLPFAGTPTRVTADGVFAVSLQFKTSLKCLAFALSDGTAGVISSSNFTFDKQITGHWAVPPPRKAGLAPSNATYVALNPRFRLLAVGYDTGDVAVFTIEPDRSLHHSYTVSQFTNLSGITPKKSKAGAVSSIKFTDDGYALAVGWCKGGVRVWSVFGCLLMSSTDETTSEVSDKPAVDGVLSLSWGPEGYNLMVVSAKSTRVMKYQFVKSALANNATLSNQFNVALQGDASICVNPDMGDSRSPRNVDKLLDLQWQMLQAPQTYLDMNWPVRFVAVGPSAQYVAIAGRKGVAHFNMVSRKWRLFGNQTQEQSLECVGGIVWWNQYLVVSCKISSGQYEVRFFPREANLDNRHMTHVQMISREVLLLNVCGDRLIVYTSARRVTIFVMSLGKEKGSDHAPVELQVEWDVDLRDYVVHSCNVISVSLNHAGSDAGDVEQLRPSSLIVNVSGRILMFPFEVSETPDASTFGPPALLAAGVENYWAWAPTVCAKLERHLDEALWLGCGGQGMKVWLPLYAEAGLSGEEGLSKRVMLPFNLNIYPLSVLFSDAVVLGASHDVHHFSAGKFPFYALERKTQIYLHHILRQLLRRSQDCHALQIAQACQGLPYFSHVVELMLHEVLEDEASDDLDVANAQLPRVAGFMRKFPHFLENVVQCARKSEMAKWRYLFSVVGDAKTLFEACIADNLLSTASSYLIILQSLESPVESAQQAVRILELALVDENWVLAKDLVRFLHATSNYKPEGSPGSTRPALNPAGVPKTYGDVFADSTLKLLQAHRIRAIGRFSAALHFPLLAWLKKVRAKVGLALDFKAALAQVRADFPLQSQHAPVQGDASPGADGKALALSKRDVASIRGSVTAMAEIIFLMNVFFETKFLDWAFLCAVIINDEAAASRVIEEIAADKETKDGVFGLMKRFNPVVQDGGGGSDFKPFFERLESKFRSAKPIPTDLEREVPGTRGENSGCVTM